MWQVLEKQQIMTADLSSGYKNCVWVSCTHVNADNQSSLQATLSESTHVVYMNVDMVIEEYNHDLTNFAC